MAPIRRLFRLILALAVILGGTESAVARSEMASAIYPVLCGAAPGSVAFDPNGRPLPQRNTCPHCLAAAAHAAALPDAAFPWVAVTGRATPVDWQDPPCQAHAPRTDLPEARGPPPRP